MKQSKDEYIEMEELAKQVKYNINNTKFCKELILQALIKYSDAPQPQNLLGALAEFNDDKILAMKHYRASWSLAPNYRPAKDNISRLTDIHYNKQIFFTDMDCKESDISPKRYNIMHRKFWGKELI